MREIFTYGSVGRAPGNRCLYPETDVYFAGAQYAPVIYCVDTCYGVKLSKFPRYLNFTSKHNSLITKPELRSHKTIYCIKIS